ncbi:Flp pilus assembly protein CpaB [Pseudodesulfovibrio senegalensis]|jgi:pilus assembly protein CpaB|uniref:Flp pilus assembly protein CpaB n=1 Tax=Pseudodesulfovibrio senegalensis TaxID=1721087 RepID=A0A6N6N1Y6_9BACT|nr:Flp pilus assembly protein CpaB [Pseudodesulfovibrio senegalensis]KAB1441826.1 Flp pilus assembly protein CpaB [Pseudodesulfovibrio senegalensis]
MSRSSRAIIQIGLALVLSLVAATLIFRWMSSRPVKQAAVPTVPVVVAKMPIKKGSKIPEESLVVRQYAQEAEPAGAVGDFEGLVGRTVAMDVGVNEPVTRSKLVGDKPIGGISAMIAPGKRAMAVKGNMVMGLSGFVHPGDRVDVLVSLTEGREEKPVTKMVLEWVKVLATGTQLDTPTEEGVTASVDVYTLELSPQESERLALASTRGTLHFALRNLVDNATVLTHGETPKSALAAFRPKPKPKKRVRGKKQVSVQVISGADATKVKF